jgi:hypothetical protein
LYAGLTRGATWRHPTKFVDLEDDAPKSLSDEYFFCDYDVRAKPIWFTPGIFVDDQLRPLSKQRNVVDRNDFNVVDEDYPSTGGGGRPYYVPTYGRIESVLPDHRLITCGLSEAADELKCFQIGQTFMMGKKRTMFQILDVSAITDLGPAEADFPIEECQPVQVNTGEVKNFREYEILAGTARYLLVRGRSSGGSLIASFSFSVDTPAVRRVLPSFWVDRVQQILAY